MEPVRCHLRYMYRMIRSYISDDLRNTTVVSRPFSQQLSPSFCFFSSTHIHYFHITLFTMFSESVLSLLTLASAVAAQQCPIQFDGRIGTNATAASFDTSASPFSPTNVFGQSESHYILCEPLTNVSNKT